MQLSGNVSKRAGGGVTAALALHFLAPPPSSPAAPPPGVVLQGPLTQRSKLDAVIDAPPPKKSRGRPPLQAAAAAATLQVAAANAGGSVVTAAAALTTAAAEVRAVPLGPWVAWSGSLLAEAGLQVLRSAEGGIPEVCTVLLTKTSLTAAQVNLDDPQLVRLLQFAFG